MSERTGHGEAVDQPSKQEIAVRVATMRTAVVINLLCAAAMCAYAWASPNHALRLTASAVFCIALLAGAGAQRYLPRLYRSGGGRRMR